MFKRHYIALVVVVGVVLIVLNLPSQTVAKFKLAIGSLFLPLFGLAASGQNAAEKVGNTVLPRSEILRQNEQLRKENADLKLRLGQTDELLRENVQLREYVRWQKLNPGKYKLARVVGRDPANWWRTIQIDVGRRDGIQTNLPVRTIEGLVGRVSDVGEMRSQVLLLGDANLRVGALVVETRENGIVFSGTSTPLENNMVDLGYLARSSEAKPGQTVITSGDGGLFPKGITIGKIVDLQLADNGLNKEARVRLAARMNALEEVWVVLP